MKDITSASAKIGPKDNHPNTVARLWIHVVLDDSMRSCFVSPRSGHPMCDELVKSGLLGRMCPLVESFPERTPSRVTLLPESPTPHVDGALTSFASLPV